MPDTNSISSDFLKRNELRQKQYNYRDGWYIERGDRVEFCADTDNDIKIGDYGTVTLHYTSFGSGVLWHMYQVTTDNGKVVEFDHTRVKQYIIPYPDYFKNEPLTTPTHFWLLTRLDDIVIYDNNEGFVIEAASEQEARQIAADNAADEGRMTWLSSSKSSCKPIVPSKTPQVILRDFHAG